MTSLQAEIDVQSFTWIAHGLRFPEGPVAMADGSVLLVELERGMLSRVAVDGTVDVGRSAVRDAQRHFPRCACR
jgi:hypothetical protein